MKLPVTPKQLLFGTKINIQQQRSNDQILLDSQRLLIALGVYLEDENLADLCFEVAGLRSIVVSGECVGDFH